ncbi:MAG TPA: hypothetical protein VJ921_03250 [Vicinamibacteria bacterium]|nr:hypothetical protein [Vicinamibacteria bacterium]
MKPNEPRSRTFRRVFSFAGATAALGLFLGAAAPTQAQSEIESKSFHSNKERIVFTVDVAEDFAAFVPTPVDPADTIPQRGSFFVTEGRIFPAGTIKGDGASFDPNSNGSLGRWFCRGTHLVSGDQFVSTKFAVDTAQLFMFPNDERSIVTDGVEGGGKVERVVSGGTGAFKDYVGIQKQEFLGFNASGGVNLRVTFVLRRAVR